MVFEDMYYYTVKHAIKMFGKQRLDKDIPILKIRDSTMIDFPFSLAKTYRYDSKQNSSAVKIRLCLMGTFLKRSI